MKIRTIFLLISGTTGTAVQQAPQLSKPKVQITAAQTLPSVKMEIDEPSAKRKRDEEDYDVP